MRSRARRFLIAIAGLACASPAWADQEASNYPHVVAGPYGRCYAKSVPDHLYDPSDGPRQQGLTEVYRVGPRDDVLLHRFDWFSQGLFVRCRPGRDTLVVRLGPWHRGHDPRPDHLAIAFYESGKLLKSYSTLDIAGDAPAEEGSLSKYRNVAASVSHYTVFASGPQMARVTTTAGGVFQDDWVIRATTLDGRALTFDVASGELR
jgi:hypothetical protein